MHGKVSSLSPDIKKDFIQ